MSGPFPVIRDRAGGPERRMLVIHSGALGDLVVTFPLLDRLTTQGYVLHLLSRGETGRLAVHGRIVARAHALEAAWAAALFVRPLPESLKIWLANFSSILVFSRSTHLVELASDLSGQRVICIPPRPPVKHSMHVTRFLWTSLSQAGFALPERIPRRGIKRCFRSVGRNAAGNGSDGERIVVLHPGSGSPRKNLPLACWLETAEILENRGYGPIWLLGPAEEELKGRLENCGIPEGRVWVCNDLVALAGKLEGVRGFIGHDSGLSHLAAYLGLAVLAIFTSSDPRRWRPWGERVKVLRADLECRPCFETEAANCAAAACRYGITAQMIVAAVWAWEREARQLPNYRS